MSVTYIGASGSRKEFRVTDTFGTYSLNGPTFGLGPVYLTLPGWGAAIRVDDPGRFGERFDRTWVDAFAAGRTEAAHTPALTA